MFKDYDSKPIVRSAVRITQAGLVSYLGDNNYVYKQGIDHVYFKAHQYPVLGDWIVRLTQEDTYHCTDEVFRERNVVPEGE